LFFRAAPTPGASALAEFLARLEAEHGDPVAAFDHLTLAIRNYHNAGDTTTIRVPLAVLAALFDRLGRYEPAATIAGFALSPLAAVAVSEITTAIAHLRDVLGEATYESLARKGETMTTAAMATYAYDQIDQARAGLEHSA
jgi:ABC-type multidrug transport system fused ATPase/permease subunit